MHFPMFTFLFIFSFSLSCLFLFSPIQFPFYICVFPINVHPIIDVRLCGFSSLFLISCELYCVLLCCFALDEAGEKLDGARPFSAWEILERRGRLTEAWALFTKLSRNLSLSPSG